MIIYDLRCGKGHAFEGWFKDRENFLGEQKTGRLECPLCGDREVALTPSGAHVPRSREGKPSTPRTPPLLKVLGEYLQKNFEDVGKRFAEEALRIHSGETERRNIRGSATPEEEQELREEGVEFAKVPIPRFDS